LGVTVWSRSKEEGGKRKEEAERKGDKEDRCRQRAEAKSKLEEVDEKQK
jgi:hypothetical protein